MDLIKDLQAEIDRGFSKAQLERLIGLPQNCLSGVLKGDKKLSKKSILKVQKYMAGDRPDPLDITENINQDTAGFKGIIPAMSGGHQVPVDMSLVGPLIEKIQATQTEEEKPQYDFTGMKFLDAEKFTKFPVSQRPANKFERAIWDSAKAEDLKKIRESWNNRNK